MFLDRGENLVVGERRIVEPQLLIGRAALAQNIAQILAHPREQIFKRRAIRRRL